jgi:hypothetical protein
MRRIRVEMRPSAAFVQECATNNEPAKCLSFTKDDRTGSKFVRKLLQGVYRRASACCLTVNRYLRCLAAPTMPEKHAAECSAQLVMS